MSDALYQQYKVDRAGNDRVIPPSTEGKRGFRGGATGDDYACKPERRRFPAVREQAPAGAQAGIVLPESRSPA